MIKAMKTLKPLLLAALFIYAGSLLHAQDERVHPYMKAVSGQFDLQEGYVLTVDYIMDDVMNETSFEGEARIWMKGEAYRMEVEEYIIYYDGEKLWSQNTDLEEVYLSIPDPSDASYFQSVPISVIKSYQQDFRYVLKGTKPFKGRECAEIQLSPIDLGGPYSLLMVYVHAKTMELEGFLLKHKEGINYTLHIVDKQVKKDLGEEDFRFHREDYPETELIELIQ